MKRAIAVLAGLLYVGVATAQPATGILRGVVFSADEGTPVANVKLTIKAGTKTFTVTTSSSGGFSLSVPDGAARLAIPLTAKRPGVEGIRIVSGRTTEVLLHVDFKRGTVSADVEAPGGARKVAKVVRSEAPKVRLQGRVLAQKSGKPIAAAQIVIKGLKAEAVTTSDGRFTIEVPIRKRYDLTVLHAKFATKQVVALGHAAELLVRMDAAGVLVDDYTVTAPRIVGNSFALLKERRNSSHVADLVGAAEMSRSGDSDAASALRRVTGITVVGGKYAYVRGLGKRYSSTLFNGAQLPSPEPGQRVIPLDLFPAEILDSVVVQKSFSPDLPGEFGGGAVKLRTRPYPRRFLAKISLSTGYRAGTTFTNSLQGPGGGSDFLGVDGGHRSLPDNVREASSKNPLLERDLFNTRGYTAAQLEQFGEAMPNRWTATPQSVAPNFGVNATLGNSTKLWGGTAGFLVGLIYSNGWDPEPAAEQNIFTSSTIFANGGSVEDAGHRYRSDKLTNNITLAGMLSAGWDRGDQHKIKLTSLVARVTDNSARSYSGYNRDLDSDLRITRLTWIERMLVVQQLTGQHQLTKKLKMDWSYAFSLATRLEPDRREVRYDLDPVLNDWFLSDRPEGNQRFFGDQSDTAHDLRLGFALPFKQWSGLDSKLKAGAALFRKDRSVDVRRFTFRQQGPRSTDQDLLRRSPEQIFLPENIGSDGFIFTETTLPTDNYTADHTIAAAHALTEMPLTKTIKLMIGARFEYSRQALNTFKPFSPSAEKIGANLGTFDLLPAATLSWNVAKHMVLRASVSQTVSRPTLRELSPAISIETTGGRLYQGNPDLDRARLTHGDIRWEWYFSDDGESMALSGFVKHFNNPIEVVAIPSAQISVTPSNAQGALNFGFEIEGRKSLSFIHRKLRDLYIGANAAWIWSRVNLDPETIQTNKNRPLQGQSPFVVNARLGYRNIDTGTSVALLYNVFGRRIAEVGVLGSPDIYQEPAHQLDLVVRQSLGSGFSISAKGQNLLNAAYRRTQGGLLTDRFVRGQAVSVSLAKSY